MNKIEQIIKDTELDKMVIGGNFAPVINKGYISLLKTGDVSGFLSIVKDKVKLNKELGLDVKQLVKLYNHVYSNYS